MLDAAVKSLAQEPNLAAVSTLGPDGQPMTHLMWVGADDDHLLINTEVERQKYRNISRDPRVTVAIVDRNNPYHYAEVRGRVVDKIIGDRARDQLEELSQQYTGAPYALPIQSDRVLLFIQPERARVQ